MVQANEQFPFSKVNQCMWVLQAMGCVGIAGYGVCGYCRVWGVWVLQAMGCVGTASYGVCGYCRVWGVWVLQAMGYRLPAMYYVCMQELVIDSVATSGTSFVCIAGL